MKRMEKIWIGVTTIVFIIICICTFVLVINEKEIPTYVFERLRILLIIGCLLVFLSMMILGALHVITFMKNVMHNIKNCNDKIFGEIDRYKKCWKESRENYIHQIRIINLVYRENGEVDGLVENREIDRLFARADYLLIQITLFDNVTTAFTSVIISVVATFICQMLECNEAILMVLWTAVIFISFFGAVLFRYAKRGHDGSYRYLVDEYERKRLLEKIEILEKDIEVTTEDRDLLETKQVVLEALIEIANRCKFSKQREEVAKDIRRVEKLELFLGTYNNCYKQEICVNNKKCYLLYYQQKESDYTGKKNLRTKDFVILYEILEKYGFIEAIKRSTQLNAN